MRVTTKRDEGNGFRASTNFEIKIDGEPVGAVFKDGDHWVFGVGSDRHGLAKYRSIVYRTWEIARMRAVEHVKEHGKSRTAARDAEVDLENLRFYATRASKEILVANGTKVVVLLVSASGNGDVAVGSNVSADEVRKLLERAYRTAPIEGETTP